MQGIFIYLLPPSMKVLHDRRVRRQTDDRKAIEKRLGEAKRELEYVDRYDYAVVNEKIGTAVDTVRSIIAAERCRTSRLSLPEYLSKDKV